jgi:hypothetical protein
MCHLIEDSSPAVQKMAYQLLKGAAKKRTEHFVIEAGVDTDAVVRATIPTELLDIILREMHFGYNPDAEDDSQDREQNMFGYLLGWMLVFDLFQDAVSGFVKRYFMGRQLNFTVSISLSK